MKHYFNPASRAVTTHWMLEELGVDYEQITLDFEEGGTQAPAFRAINPMGKVPTLVDGDVVVTEVAAICAHLADRFPEKGMAPPIGSSERGQYFRYLFFPGTTLEPMFTSQQNGMTSYSAASVGWGDLDRCMAAVDAMTPSTGWALETGFSAADVVYGGTLDFAVQFGWIETPTDKVAAYVRRLKARPAYRATHDATWH